MPVLLTKEEIHQRFDMKQFDPINRLDHDRVIYFEGDTTINGDLTSDWAAATLEELKEDTDLGSVLISSSFSNLAKQIETKKRRNTLTRTPLI